MSVSMINSINKYKEIYSNLDCYKELRESDQEFFDNLFLLLLFKDANNELSNKFLSKRLDMPESTIEKRLRRLERAHLIIRYIAKTKKDDYWITFRSIKLDSITFAWFCEMNNINMSEKEAELFKNKRKEIDETLEREKLKEEFSPKPKKRRIIHV